MLIWEAQLLHNLVAAYRTQLVRAVAVLCLEKLLRHRSAFINHGEYYGAVILRDTCT